MSVFICMYWCSWVTINQQHEVAALDLEEVVLHGGSYHEANLLKVCSTDKIARTGDCVAFVGIGNNIDAGREADVYTGCLCCTAVCPVWFFQFPSAHLVRCIYVDGIER